MAILVLLATDAKESQFPMCCDQLNLVFAER